MMLNYGTDYLCNTNNQNDIEDIVSNNQINIKKYINTTKIKLKTSY